MKANEGIPSSGTQRTRANRGRRHRKIRKVLSSLWLTVAFATLALAGYQVASGNWHATPVLSGSMRPGLQPGDVVVTHQVPISDLHVRDVIVFLPPDEGDQLTVHRIVDLSVSGGTTSIMTWGDANPVADPAISSLRGSTAYLVVRVIPLVGYPAVWLQNGQRGLMVIGLGVILLIAALVTVFRPDKIEEPPRSAGPAERPTSTMAAETSSGPLPDGEPLPDRDESVQEAEPSP
ncbi:MAG: signal peptidase I [Actinomycetota bacterium]